MVEERNLGAADREPAPLDDAAIDVDLACGGAMFVAVANSARTTENVRNVPNDVCVRVSTLV